MPITFPSTPAALVLAATVLAVPLAGQETPTLTDPEIAHVAVTANAIDVEMAELARSRAESDDVLAFAGTMIADHTSVNERAAALAERLGVTPLDNDVSRSLRSGAASARDSLAPLEGAAFDRRYMQREIAYHQAVLDALDDVLIPQADNGDLRSLLEDVRPVIAAHVVRARAIAEDLGGPRP